MTQDSIDPLDPEEFTEDQVNDILQPNVGDYNPTERIIGNDNGLRGNVLAVQSGGNSPEDLVNTEDNHVANETTSEKITEKEGEDKKRKETKKDAPITWAERLKLSLMFLKVYVKVFCLFLGVLSLYWASMYNRPSRYTNLNFIVVLGDASTEINGTTIEPYIGETFIDMVQNNETVSKLAGWKIHTENEIQIAANVHNITLEAELKRLVHHQKCWAAIYIKPNSTAKLYDSLVNANPSLVENGQISNFIDVIFEDGRHYSALTQYINKHLVQAEETWLSYYTSSKVFDPLVGHLSLDQKLALLQNDSTIQILTSPPTFNLIDLSHTLSSSALGPSQLGLIYAQIFSFHQFNFSLQIHQYLRSRLVFRHFIIYRLLSSQINYLVLGLVYALVTIAFKVPVNLTFGDSGFVVLWMFMYLFISAAGGINENIVMIILSFDMKTLLAPWMVFFIIINIAPTFSALELCPGFFKYGYALPMYNVFEALKVVLFNTWKGHLGRHLGILVTWIVVSNICLVFNVRWELQRQKDAAAKAEAKKKEAKEKQELEQLQQQQEEQEQLGDQFSRISEERSNDVLVEQEPSK